MKVLTFKNKVSDFVQKSGLPANAVIDVRSDSDKFIATISDGTIIEAEQNSMKFTILREGSQ